MEKLSAEVSCNDPLIPVVRPSQEYGRYAVRRSVEVGRDFDLIVIATDHYEYRNIY